MLKQLFRPRLRHVLLFIATLGLVLAVVRFVTISSEPYSFANDFVASDQRITQVTGMQSKRSLVWWPGFGFAYGDNSGHAEFTFTVVGQRGTFKVAIKVEKKEGRWLVQHARVIAEQSGSAVDVMPFASAAN
jgi:hypothetical protein